MAGAPLMLTAAVIATATGGSVTAGDPNTIIDGFSIDSRTLQRGDLFFAIVAARDGHDFIDTAVQNGAAAIVVHKEIRAGMRTAGGISPVVIAVPDTTTALQDLGRFVR